ncbi:MAG: 16S rRNA (cytosine(967)-C(5))-methyltransferase RsmB [Candidatus Humimicrobiaceae bacterium]
MKIDNMNSPNPRKTALDILERYFESETHLRTLFNEILDSAGLSGLDRRFAFNIVKGTVRYAIRLDFIISYLTQRRLEAIDPLILNILRMGIFQLQFMDRVPSYSIVDESVKLAKSKRPHASGFVNAVMRKASSIKNPDILLEGLFRKKKFDGIKVLSIRYSYPEWIIEYWMEHFGRDKTIKLCRYLNRTPGFYLRTNKVLAGENKSTAEDLGTIGAVPVNLKSSSLSDLQKDFTEIFEPIAFSARSGQDKNYFSHAASLSSASGLEKTKLFLEGLVTIQDLSSQMAVRYFLDPQPGEKILDVCAAPGGKTSFIADLMDNKGEIAAVDITDEKLKLLRQNISRMKSSIVKTFRADASKIGFLGDEKYHGYFDRIFVDAPCSAFGTISKNPEVKYNKKKEDLERLSTNTLKILSASGKYLKKGGRFVFYTCTLSPVENQQTVENFITNSSDEYIVEKIDPGDPSRDLPGDEVGDLVDNADKSIDMQLEIMPYYLGSEGGFVSVFKKC